jgi:opacity protein-like surface antigen
MKKFLLCLCCLPLTVQAQDFHFSARLGLANYHGDLTQHTVSVSGAKPFFSLGARYDLSEHLTARTYFSLTSLQADDKKGPAAMQARNLNFKTRVFEWELSGQYNLLNLNDRWWTPYVFAGIGIYRFNPSTTDAAGSKVFLQPLSTEGQGFRDGASPYKRTQFSVPFGFGADYSLNEDMRLGLEFGYRKLFTDYVDDVSTTYVDQNTLLHAKGEKAVELAWRGDEINGAPYPVEGTVRGNPGAKDGYYYVALTYTIRYFFDKYKAVAGIPSGKRDKKVGCPATRY